MTPNDQRPDIPILVGSPPIAPKLASIHSTRSHSYRKFVSRAVQLARSPPGPYPGALACGSSQPIPSLTPLLNPHRASRTAGALPTANSCLGAFRTPAASACTDDRHRRRPKTCTVADLN